jgi:ComF family protein
MKEVLSAAFHKALGSLVDSAFPTRCAGCGCRGNWVCSDCDDAFPEYQPPWCHRCGTPDEAADCLCSALAAEIHQFRAYGPHEGWLRHAVHALKYGEETDRARQLGRLLTPLIESLDPWDWVVPVPLHSGRQRERGFNQAELLTHFAVDDKTKIVPALVRRIRATPHQVGLNAHARRLNLQGAFAVLDPNLTVGRRIVLVDDVMTTGSTLEQCALALLDAGALSVSAVALATGN